ncbi:Lon protease family protein [Candidatus Micrarchaeota archaeon]|mgnify:CR=1 FL=1|nr:MAG: Lon protease family protein [Candidatus Micrarchaeota archaeon]
MATWSTARVKIPTNPLLKIIGHDEVLQIARLVAKQRRHLLLVGPPGTGKSMIAQVIACLLPKPLQEVSVLHNPENPERPIVEVRRRGDTDEKPKRKIPYKLLSVTDVPHFVAERLGLRCRRCGSSSAYSSPICPSCGADKRGRESSPFDDLLFGYHGELRDDRVHTTRRLPTGREEPVVYERTDDNRIKLYDHRALRALERMESKKPRKIIVSLDRTGFVQATGASETELLGDVRHDPYGGHPEIGTAAYLRVIPGAVHEAHEGVLFIDELSTLGYLQRYLLTALQEKQFPITGRNASSTGASVKVENVPCDFILVGALNTNDIDQLLPPLRSRILGNGYEILLNTTMPDNEKNRRSMVQFIAQEIQKDGRIPHANKDAVELILEESRRRAKQIDDARDSLTLRLRDLSGIIKIAGDLAVLDDAPRITAKHIKAAMKRSKAIEEQLYERYESWWKAGGSDYGNKRKFSVGSSSEIA